MDTQRNGLVFIYNMSDSKYSNFDYELSQKMLSLLKGRPRIQLMLGSTILRHLDILMTFVDLIAGELKCIYKYINIYISILIGLSRTTSYIIGSIRVLLLWETSKKNCLSRLLYVMITISIHFFIYQIVTCYHYNINIFLNIPGCYKLSLQYQYTSLFPRLLPRQAQEGADSHSSSMVQSPLQGTQPSSKAQPDGLVKIILLIYFVLSWSKFVLVVQSCFPGPNQLPLLYL